jgi:hypothetical protein
MTSKLHKKNILKKFLKIMFQICVPNQKVQEK